jgi:hypothetical protein
LKKNTYHQQVLTVLEILYKEKKELNMGTNAPAIRTHDIPITEPYKPPLQIPAPSPDTLITIEPIQTPVREPVPVRRK